MDLRSVAFVILDHQQKILYSSSGAGEIFDEFPALLGEAGEWKGPMPPEGELVEVDGASPGSRIRLARTWIMNGKPEVGYAGVVLCPLRQKPEMLRSKLLKAYRLTPAELKLAGLLIEGLRPQAAAAELGITIHTVRTYLKRLYRKVGVRSQTTLVCALNKALN